MIKALIACVALICVMAGCAAEAPLSSGRQSSPATQPKAIRVLITGGGNSHQFARWYGEVDSALLRAMPGVTVDYTEDVDGIGTKLAETDVLCIANNKPFNQAATRQAITDFVNAGKGLVLLHAGMWYSWNNWPEFNRVLVGGGAREHDQLGGFEVKVTEPASPIMKDVPAAFAVTDELYHMVIDNAGTPILPLATAYSKLTDKTYASVFIVQHPKGRIVGIALGHDGGSHDVTAYQQVLKNSVEWAAGR